LIVSPLTSFSWKKGLQGWYCTIVKI